MTAADVQIGTAETLWYGLGRVVLTAPVRQEHLLTPPGLPIVAVIPDWIRGCARDRCFAALLLQVRLRELGYCECLARLGRGRDLATAWAEKETDDDPDLRDRAAGGAAA